MCTIAAGLMAASAAVQYAGQVSATNAYNAQAATAHRDAQIAATNKYKDLDTKYTYDIKSTNKEGYKAAMKGRAEEASGIASAGAAGIAPGSLTLDALINATRQTAAENEATIQAKREDLAYTLSGNKAGVQAEASQRINSMPYKASPNPLGLAINMAGAAGQGAVDAKWIDKDTFGTMPKLWATG